MKPTYRKSWAGIFYVVRVYLTMILCNSGCMQLSFILKILGIIFYIFVTYYRGKKNYDAEEGRNHCRR